MLPGDLRAESFVRYPPEARSFAVSNLPVLRQMPLVLLSVVLRQMIQYDWCFPAEREQLSVQFDVLKRMDAVSFDALMTPFSTIPLSAELRVVDWVNNPRQFSEQLTAYLWSAHQIDRYHEAAQAYQDALQKFLPQKAPAAPRWTIVAIGQGTEYTRQPVFRRLQSYGTIFTQVDPKGALETLFNEAASRAQRYPMEYGHWYIEGGALHPGSGDGLTSMSYARLVPVVRRELVLLNRFLGQAGNSGPSKVEGVTSYIANLSPDDVGRKGTAADAALRHFEVNLLTQGAGCQIYSTTFVQWAVRECLHRAQPLTLFARFAPRQMSAPMEQLLTRDPLEQVQDREGSLVDADMGAYYTWINQSRLAGSDQSRFLAWFEGSPVVCAISPSLPKGATSVAPATMQQILKWMA